MITLRPLAAILELGYALSFPRLLHGSSFNVPSNSNESFAAARGEMMGSAKSLQGVKATSPRRVAVVYPKLLPPTSNPDSLSPAASASPSSPATDFLSRLETRQAMADDVLDLITYQPTRYTSYTISLRVFLLDTSELMDVATRSTFELAALQFIVDEMDQRNDISIESISDVGVVNQKLTWSRVVEGKSTTGIEVYFDVEATVSGDVEKQQVERAVQLLFDTNARSFRSEFHFALRGEATSEAPETTTELLEPIRYELGLASIAAGCIGFVAILVASGCYVTKKEKEEGKDLSKTSIVDANDNQVRVREGFPIQQATSQGIAYASSDSDDVLTFDDNSFNASLVFCPSVEKEQKDLCAVFDCDESAIAADLENNTDSDGDDAYEYSPVQRAKGLLTNDDLRDFDTELRRAEC